MATLINNHRRGFHLPKKFRDGRDAFVDARDEDGNRIKVPNDSEAFGGTVMLPAATVSAQQTTPGRVDVPDWYLERLVEEPGWRKRLERGGGVEVEGFGHIPDAKSDAVRAKDLEVQLKRSDRERSSLELELERRDARVRELEAELAAAKAPPKSEPVKEPAEKPSKAEKPKS